MKGYRKFTIALATMGLLYLAALTGIPFNWGCLLAAPGLAFITGQGLIDLKEQRIAWGDTDSDTDEEPSTGAGGIPK